MADRTEGQGSTSILSDQTLAIYGQLSAHADNLYFDQAVRRMQHQQQLRASLHYLHQKPQARMHHQAKSRWRLSHT